MLPGSADTKRGHFTHLASWRRWTLEAETPGRFPMALALPTLMALLVPVEGT